MDDDIRTYPVTIRESRYSGTYSGGGWVITAGIYYPGKTAAFGGDIPCMEFWKRQRLDGPVLTMVDPRYDEETQVYVESGDNPEELLDEMNKYFDE